MQIQNRTGCTLLLAATIAFGGCHKEDSATPVDTGGKGGAATLNITSMHHSAKIDSITVYIKYNAEDVPTFYDDSFKCAPSSGVTTATFSGLKNGKYYLYGYGYDPAIREAVKGGMSYTVTDQAAQSVKLAVTED